MYENVVLNFSLVAHFIYFHWRQDSAVYPFFPFFVWTTCHSVCVQWTVYSCMNVSCTVYYAASTHKVTLIIAMMVKNLWFGCARGNEWIHLHRWHQFTLFFWRTDHESALLWKSFTDSFVRRYIYMWKMSADQTNTISYTCAVVVFVSPFCISVMLCTCTCTCIVSTGYSARKNLIISCY